MKCTKQSVKEDCWGHDDPVCTRRVQNIEFIRKHYSYTHGRRRAIKCIFSWKSCSWLIQHFGKRWKTRRFALGVSPWHGLFFLKSNYVNFYGICCKQKRRRIDQGHNFALPHYEFLLFVAISERMFCLNVAGIMPANQKDEVVLPRFEITSERKM